MKKVYYWLIGIVLVFIITNPSFSDFENHLPSKDSPDYDSRIKLNNYFIAGVYVHEVRTKHPHVTFGTSYYYLGILGNFFMIGGKSLIVDHFTPVKTQ